MTDHDQSVIEAMARALLSDQGDPGKGQPVRSWEEQPEAFQRRMTRNAQAAWTAAKTALAEQGMLLIRQPTPADLEEMTRRGKQIIKKYHEENSDGVHA